MFLVLAATGGLIAIRLAFELPPPIGAVAYPDAEGGRRLAIVRADGTAFTCAGGEKIEVSDVARGTVLYTDRDLYVVPLACDRPPRRVARVADLTPSRKAGVDCARFSPDGRWIALTVNPSGGAASCSGEGEVWVGRADGSGWRRLSTRTALGWVDDRHVLAAVASLGDVHEWDPYAVDVRTGRKAFFLLPPMWRGSRSPDAKHVVFDLRFFPGGQRRTWLGRYFRSGTRVVEGPKRRARAVVLSGGFFQEGIASAWDPSASRIVGLADEAYNTKGEVPIRVFAADGRVLAAIRVRGRAPFPQEMRVGWMGSDRIWVRMLDGIVLVDVSSGKIERVRLPSRVRSRPGAPFLYGSTDLMLFAEDGRQGMLSSEPTLVDAADAPAYKDARLGLSFRRPPSWRVELCPCGPHPVALALRAIEPASDLVDDAPFPLTISATSDSVSTVERTLAREYEVGREVTPEHGSTLRVSRTMIGGVMFRTLRFGFWEGVKILHVGRPGRRTLVIAVNPLNVDDPSLRLVLDSMRFERA